MSTELRSCLVQLKACLDTQQVPRARNVISRISQLTVETTSESQAETEYNLECIFNAPNGLVAFLQRSFSNAKQFAKANEDVFELFRKTVEKHSSLLGKWMPTIVSIALRYIQSSSVTARERELSTLVLQDCIAYGCLRKDSYERLEVLVNELLSVFHKRKLPNRFQQSIFELLGQLAKNFPEAITEPDRLRDALLKEIEIQLLEQSYPSLVSLAGALRGLDLFLFHFAPSEEEEELRKQLYLLVKKLSIWDEGRTERAAFRNALQLLAHHAPLFTVYLYEDHVHWQTTLAGKWLKSTNRDDRQAALGAMYAFHGEVSRVLCRPEIATDSQRECPRAVDVLNQYLAYYRKLLNSASGDRWEMRVAVRGFGIMAGACHRLSNGSSASLNELLTIVLDRIEGVCGQTEAGDMLEHLPDFMQALSEILTQARELSTVQLVSVQTMVVALMRDFYHLSTVHHELIVRSLLCTLENIGKLGGTSLDHLLDNVFLQGIIWSCTHSLPYGPSDPVPQASENYTPRQPFDWKRELVTYRNYLPLWQGLLERRSKDASKNEDDTLTRSIYRALMRTLFLIVGKLDLSTRKRTFQDEDGQQRELFFCDPNLDRVPSKPKDFHIFLNLVELYRELMHGPRTSAAVRELFAEWIHRYFEQFVKLSLAHPLVSGFVKLIEMGLLTADKIGHFGRALDDPDSRSTAMLLVLNLECTIRRSLQTTGELQLACLRFVLNAPARLLMDFTEEPSPTAGQQPLMVSVFQVAFRLGRGLISIARTALACLQRIVRSEDRPMQSSQREQLLRQVLPMLEPYLQTRDSTQPPAVSVRLAKFKRQRTANVPSEKIERIKQQHRFEQSTEMSELVAFQLRILHFLGDLQPNECVWMVQEDGHEQHRSDTPLASLVRWDADNERSIELRLLCASGTRPCIKLDGIIGRVCQLAMDCSDRATKLSACELLHTTVLYLLGIHYQDQLHGLWSQLCRHLLQLSCDTDLAVCQMFEPLLFQIIHYLTQPTKLAQPGTATLLDCLMEATANERNGTLRDLAVRGLREFLHWTNRQSGGTSRSYDDRMKVKRTLLELLKTYALESDTARRYGAVLAFNNLFRLLAQDDPHVVRYWFELTHALAIGFIVTEDEQQGQAARDSGAVLGQFALALEHAGKVLEQRRVLFNAAEEQQHDGEEGQLPRQIIPPAIGGGELSHLVRWLFRQCAARQRLYRRKCMQLLPRLAAAVRDVASGAEFFRKHFTTEEMHAICLQSGIRQGIDQAPSLESLPERATSGQTHASPITDVYLWLEYFLATCDITCWLVREELIGKDSARVLLGRVLPAVRYFLQALVHRSVGELMDLVKRKNKSDVAATTSSSSSSSSMELRKNADKIVHFNALKTALVMQVIEMLALLLDSPELSLELCDLLGDPGTVRFLLELLFEPQQFSIDYNVPAYHEPEADRHLAKLLNTVIVQLTSRKSLGDFSQALSDKIATLMEQLSGRMSTLLLQTTIGEADQKIAKGLLFVAKHQQRRTVESRVVMEADRGRVLAAARTILARCFGSIAQEDGVRIVLAPSAARFGTIVLQAILGLSIVGERVDESPLLRRVIQCSLNCVKLQPNIHHGQHFVGCFGAAVFDLFLTDAERCMNTLLDTLTVDNFHAIVRFLCDLMEYLYRSQSPDSSERLRSLVEILLRGWNRIYECSRAQENSFGTCDLQLIELMSNLAMICPFALSEVRSQVDRSYERWLVELIGNQTAPIALKSKAIVLLPTLLGREPSDGADAALAQSLERLQATHFPLRSAEFPPASPQRIGYVNCLERLLDALVVSRSPLLLKEIIQMTAPDGEGNVIERQIRAAIEQFFSEQPYEAQRQRLQEIWQLFADHAYAPNVRATVLRRYLCTGLWRCRYDTVTEFYRRNIRAISELVGAELTGRTGWALEHALVDRAAGFRLVEQYAALLPKAILLAERCVVAGELYDSAAPVRGVRLVGDFSKRAYNARTSVPGFRSEDRTVVELFRRYQCAAYRALVALLSNTNENARMYSVLAFRETVEKGEFLWRLLIDCSNDELYLEGGQELEESPRIMRKRVAIRREGTGGPDGGGSDGSSLPPGHSVLAESSLSQQVSRFDLNHSVMFSAREVALRDAEELAKRQQGTLSSVPLERTKINEHEVMATVCGCIRHMAAAGISTEAVVRFLAESLVDPGQPKNVRLFLAKAIDNCRRELTAHAPLLLAPLMQLIVDEQIFRGLNTLVTDLIALVLEWSTCRPPTAGSPTDAATAALASSLLRFLMKYSCRGTGANATTVRQQALRLNLELIRTLVRQWRDELTVPAELLFVMVTQRDEERSQFELIAGLQLGAIVLINGGDRGLVPWMESNREDFLWAVLQCTDSSNSAIYKPAAQLLGLCLARLYPEGVPEEIADQQHSQRVQEEEGEGSDFLRGCIRQLFNISRAQGRKLLEILYEAGKAFPSIANPFLSIISFRIPTAAVAEKRMGLELLLGGRIERFGGELYRELSSLDLPQLLRESELQLATLHLLNRALPLVSELQDLQQLIEPVGTVATEQRAAKQPAASRAVAYEILIYIHEHRVLELTEEKRQAIWRYLVRGLTLAVDEEETTRSVRARILEYLTESGQLPGDVSERFLYLLTELYDPTVEAEFLGCAVALLFDPAIRCRESKDRLFLHEYTSADVKFREYTVETGARQRHAATVLTPLFAETATQRQLQSFVTSRGSQMEQLIRATQFAGDTVPSVDFEPTQDPTRLTRAAETFAMPTQHSLLFEASSLQLDRRSQRTAGEGMEDQSDVTDKERTFERLRKRILKDTQANRQRQTSWAVGRYYSSERKRTEQRREAGSRVALFRRYRLADYPDLQINLLAFLLPLQALCQRDAPSARRAFVAIFNGLVEGFTDEWNAFLPRLDGALQRVLELTKGSDPNLFGALIELSLGRASGRLSLSPRTVASVAGACNMLTMGALYVEGKLTDGDEFDETPVRAVEIAGGGGGDGRTEADHWLQLSTLYHTLWEHDAVAGIFGDKLDSDPRLRDAIELEALGRYDRAHRVYYELIAATSPARGEERNFCYKSAYGCLMRLGQWDVLLDEIGAQVTSHDELWSDEWNQENLLPSYMHGNVRLNLTGDERGHEFCRILEEWLHIPARADHLRQHFGEELTALQLASGEFVRGRLYAEQTERQFLEEWHCAGVLSELFRVECLLAVRKVIELRAYSELLEGSRMQQDASSRLVASWRNALPSVTDSLITWDTIVAYRRFLLDKLETRGDGGSVQQLSEVFFELELNLLEVAFEQSNVTYAGKMIMRLRSDEGCARALRPDQLLRLRIARLRYDRVRHLRASPGVDYPQLGKGFRRLAQLTSRTFHPDQQLHLAKAAGAAWTELFNYSESFRVRVAQVTREQDVCALVRDTIRSTLGHHDGAPELAEDLRAFSLHCLQRGIDEVFAGRSTGGATGGEDCSTSAQDLAGAYFRMAQYCYDQLDANKPDHEELPMERRLVNALLPAIRHGSREARQLFPVLLQLRNLHNGALSGDFNELVRLVPSWNFLPWIPQLLSYLRVSQATTQGSFLDELLLRLATEYPLFLYFPARVTLDGTNETAVRRPFVERFREVLRHRTMDRFVEELCRVVMPELHLLALLSELRGKLQTDSFTDRQPLRVFIETSVANVFPLESVPGRRLGKAYRAMRPYVERWLALAELDPVREQQTLAKQLEELESALKTVRPRTAQHRMQLEDLSPWLADYHYGGRREETIELPGCLHGADGPPPCAQNRHVQIVKIVPDLVVYGSLRLPVQITFRGSDGRHYRFLAKYGEDLRQDQRIQQLQQEITNRLRLDRRCTEQRLELRTYQVIPIQPNFGLLGWLEGTVSLQDIAKKASPRYNTVAAADRSHAYVLEEYGRFLQAAVVQRQTLNPNDTAARSRLTSPVLYGMAACHYPPARLRLKYLELAQTIRGDTLKRALFDMASSPEAFYRLRMNFGRSLAAMNITGWVLGIGDRHLSNIVLERATGKLIGVDFGMAFGAGTCDLPVPELVPFRLTPQFVGVMEPMRLSGVLHKCHLYTLQCLRDARKLLRACLEVFIREPTVNWLEAARQRSSGEGETGSGYERVWNPQTRVETVMRKLDGFSPKRLLVEELRVGVIAERSDFLPGYLAIVEASAELSSTLVKECGAGPQLSTELQVGMLLELATDEKLLGIAWSGWYPWF